MNGSIEFRVEENFEAGMDSTWHALSHLTVTGRYVRINKEIRAREHTLLIRYPFEMSQVEVH